MDGVMKKLEQYQKLNIKDNDAPDSLMNNLEHLQDLNKRFKQAESALESQMKSAEVEAKTDSIFNDMTNIDKMNDPNLTFKGFRRQQSKRLGLIINNYAKDQSADSAKDSVKSFNVNSPTNSIGSKSFHTIKSGVK